MFLRAQVSGIPAPTPIVCIRVVFRFRESQVFAGKIAIFEDVENHNFQNSMKTILKITFFRETKQQRRHLLEHPDRPATPGSIGFHFLDKKEDPINCYIFLKKCSSFTDVFPHICKQTLDWEQYDGFATLAKQYIFSRRR